MSSRDIILNRIRTALADRPEAELPEPPEVWPITGADIPTMAGQFAEQLEAVQGEFFRFDSIAGAGAKLESILQELEIEDFAVVDRPLGLELVEPMGDRAHRPAESWDSHTIAELPLSVLSAEWLVADTGTSVVKCETSQERLLCYLPPVCVVVAQTDQLREHLPAAWKEIAHDSREENLRGEFLFITGPSRTADIEKILILGVHGPKRLIVLLVD
jgi:L-lactate dehydrogenase complex protein LldG